MKIIDLLDDKSIRLNAEVHSKKEVLDTLVDLMDASGKLNDIETYRKGVYAREEEGSTGIGEGIAIPHCKSAAVNQAGLAAMVAPKGVEFDSLDGEPANLFFLIAAPDTADNVHLDVLSHLSVLLMDPDFTGKLREAETVEEFKKVIEMAENEPEEEKEQTEVDANVPYVLADRMPDRNRTHVHGGRSSGAQSRRTWLSDQGRDARFKRSKKCTYGRRNRESRRNYRGRGHKSTDGTF